MHKQLWPAGHFLLVVSLGLATPNTELHALRVPIALLTLRSSSPMRNTVR